jgi:cysteine desulfurase
LHGGGQEKSARAGTENVAGIAGFGVAARLALDGLKDYKRLALLRDDMEARLKNISPDIVFHGKDAPRVGNTSLFSLPGVPSETMLMAMDLEGIALSNGSACSSGSVKASSVLKAMGVPDAQAKSALRVSTGWATTKDDIERFLETWEKLAQRWKS